MKTFTFSTLLLLCLVGCQKKDVIIDATLNKTDIYFMQQASYANHDEIDAGLVAASIGNSDSVKMFGLMMATSHTEAQNSLMILGDNLNVELPTGPDLDHKAKILVLETKSGYDFDTTYINMQVMDHYAAITLFEDEISGGRNPRVKSYARENLPILKMHLQEALDIQDWLE